MDIGPEIERITVEPLEDPVPRENPAPTETPAEVEPEREAVPAGNLLTQPRGKDEQVAACGAGTRGIRSGNARGRTRP